MASAVEKVETVVIGAGVVGLAVARAFGIAGHEVLLVDRAAHIGFETSSRNSEVIHAGLYYPKDSLKAKFCVRGKHMIYDYCESRSIQCNRIGKLVVASTKGQMQESIRAMQQKARQNGVTDTRILSKEDVGTMEPNVVCEGALWSPSTGIVDSHNFMLSLLADAQELGTILALKTNIEDATIDADGRVQLYAAGACLSCATVINCAGLWADRIASLVHSNHSWQPPKQYYAKGNYFRLQGKSPFSHLIYPVPDPRGGLGIHATLDANNQVKFGPDVQWLDPDIEPDGIDTNPDAARGRSFYDSIRQYWPELQDDALTPDYAGIRPKLTHPDLVDGALPFRDFRIARPEDHGVPGLIHLFGIESPGLTSAMAIADYVVKLLDDRKTDFETS